MGHVAGARGNLVGGEGARRGSGPAVLSLPSITSNAHCCLSGHCGPYRTSEQLGSPFGIAGRSTFTISPMQGDRLRLRPAIAVMPARAQGVANCRYLLAKIGLPVAMGKFAVRAVLRRLDDRCQFDPRDANFRTLSYPGVRCRPIILQSWQKPKRFETISSKVDGNLVTWRDVHLAAAPDQQQSHCGSDNRISKSLCILVIGLFI